jgi:hypothetical protein
MTDKMPGQVSTISGALLSISVTLSSGDLIKSLILGALGTIMSYGITRLLKALFEKPPHESK